MSAHFANTGLEGQYGRWFADTLQNRLRSGGSSVEYNVLVISRGPLSQRTVYNGDYANEINVIYEWNFSANLTFRLILELQTRVFESVTHDKQFD